MCVVHAEPDEVLGKTYSKAPIVADTPPTAPPPRLVSTDIKEAGLWLWQGEAPPPPVPRRPKYRDRQFLARMMSAAGWAGWIAVPAGLALTFLAVSMMPRQDRPVSADPPGGALSSAPSPVVARPIVAVPPAEHTEAQPDQAQVPSAPAASRLAAEEPEPRVTKGRARHKASRTEKRTHASHLRKRPLFPMPGVLTPPPMAWHGGGY